MTRTGAAARRGLWERAWDAEGVRAPEVPEAVLSRFASLLAGQEGRRVATSAGPVAPGELRPEGVGELSPRQREVLALLCDGLDNAAIAARLGLTVGTVKIHLTSVYKALGAGNRTQAKVAVEIWERDGGRPLAR